MTGSTASRSARRRRIGGQQDLFTRPRAASAGPGHGVRLCKPAPQPATRRRLLHPLALVVDSQGEIDGCSVTRKIPVLHGLWVFECALAKVSDARNETLVWLPPLTCTGSLPTSIRYACSDKTSARHIHKQLCFRAAPKQSSDPRPPLSLMICFDATVPPAAAARGRVQAGARHRRSAACARVHTVVSPGPPLLLKT